MIDALNADKPFDRFVLEQLAGDELPDASAETMIATGYLRLGHWDDEPADPATDHYDQLDDMVSTTGQAFLGLTIGCARCHDHKFEPLATRDYYSLVAVFNPLRRPNGGRSDGSLPVGTRPQLDAVAARDAAIARLARAVRRGSIPKSSDASRLFARLRPICRRRIFFPKRPGVSRGRISYCAAHQQGPVTRFIRRFRRSSSSNSLRFRRPMPGHRTGGWVWRSGSPVKQSAYRQGDRQSRLAAPFCQAWSARQTISD